jgi:hypothetical protein
MKYVDWGFSHRAIGFGFGISKWGWHIDFLFWWIGGEW